MAISLTVWCAAGPGPGSFGCVWDESRVQMSLATHCMSSIDPQKTDPDEFQQIQSSRSMEEVNNCLKMVMLSCWMSCWARSRLLWVCLGWEQGPNESSYTLHVHYRFTKDWYWWISAIHCGGSMEEVNNCLEMAMLPVWAALGVFGMKAGSQLVLKIMQVLQLLHDSIQSSWCKVLYLLKMDSLFLYVAS